MKRILIFYFDYETQVIESYFRFMGWDTFAIDFASVLDCSEQDFDVVLLCVNAIDPNVCVGLVRHFRSKFNVPVLVLDRNSDKTLENKLSSINIDMYISDPIDKAALYKYVSFADIKYDLVNSNEIRYKDLVLDMHKRTVCRANRCLKLRNKEFDLLRYLLQNHGVVLSKSRILEAVWDMNALTNTTTVESHVSSLRRKLDMDFEERLLHTVHCVGYKFE